MAGKIKEMIEKIIQERSQGNPAIAEMTKAKFILKGLNPNKFDNNSEDDPEIIEKIINLAKKFNIKSLDNNKANIKSVFSTQSLESDAVLDIKSQLSGFDARILIFFASSQYDQNQLSQLMKEAFNECIVFGCSTAGELVSGKLLKNSVVAMAFNSNIISDAKVEVIDLKNESQSIESAFSSFEKHFNESPDRFDMSKYFGIILIDGLSMKEEKVMDLIGDRTNVYFVGGSAGDDLRFSKTYVYSEGKAYGNSAVLALMQISDNAEFGIIKTQSFRALENTLVANKVNEETREVIEFNNKPAIVAYAEAVGASSVEEAQSYFSIHPVGLFIGEDEVFVRSPQRVKGSSMVFYCNILEGMEVRLLESTGASIIEDTRKAVESKMNEFGRIEGLVNFNCIERTQELEKNNLLKQYGEIFSDIPTIGFSTYGEEYIGHVNQTSTMLVFKSKTDT